MMIKEVENLIKQGKESIVRLALKRINGDVTADDFTKIIVRASSKEVCVLFSFLSPIKYLPVNSAYYFDVEVSLIENSISYHECSNPEGDAEDKIDLPFYKETEDGKKNIQYVIEAIKKWIPFADSNFEESMIIRDNTEFYDIKVDSDHCHSWYKIEKLTGKIFDTRHAHFIKTPSLKDENQDKFIEIH